MKKIIFLIILTLLFASCKSQNEIIKSEVIRPHEIPINLKLIKQKNLLIKQLKDFELKYPDRSAITKSKTNIIIDSEYFIMDENICKIINQLLLEILSAVELNNIQAKLLKTNK